MKNCRGSIPGRTAPWRAPLARMRPTIATTVEFMSGICRAFTGWRARGRVWVLSGARKLGWAFEGAPGEPPHPLDGGQGLQLLQPQLALGRADVGVGALQGGKVEGLLDAYI